MKNSSDLARNARAPMIALVTLSLLNLLNYADRFVVSSLVPFLEKSIDQGGLALTHAQSGWLYSAFIVVYMIAAPAFGFIADRFPRLHVLAAAVAFWSVLTLLGGFAWGFWSLLIMRAFTGIGEAAYAGVAPAVLADEFPSKKQSRAMAFFNAAIPVGAAIGFTLGGVVGTKYGWREAFFVAGGPGLFLALMIYCIRDPKRGAMDAHIVVNAPPTVRDAVRILFRPRWLWTTAGYAFQTAGFGSLGFWTPTYLDKAWDLSVESSSVMFAAIIVVTGITGTLTGGFLGDWWYQRKPTAHLWICGLTSFLAAASILFVLYAPNVTAMWCGVTLGAFFLVMSVGPVQAHLVQILNPAERGTGMALAIFALHIFGDVPAVPMIGWIAEGFGWKHAYMSIPIFVFLAGIIWCLGAMYEERARLRSSNSSAHI
ncbi:MAG: MFS transporter [Phycisphaerales bacterium]|nr:MFS transporter [Phycisphaerales bacterium]